EPEGLAGVTDDDSPSSREHEVPSVVTAGPDAGQAVESGERRNRSLDKFHRNSVEADAGYCRQLRRPTLQRQPQDAGLDVVPRLLVARSGAQEVLHDPELQRGAVRVARIESRSRLLEILVDLRVRPSIRFESPREPIPSVADFRVVAGVLLPFEETRE